MVTVLRKEDFGVCVCARAGVYTALREQAWEWNEVWAKQGKG